MQYYLVRELFFSITKYFSDKIAGFIYYITMLFSKIAYYLSRLSGALKLTPL